MVVVVAGAITAAGSVVAEVLSTGGKGSSLVLNSSDDSANEVQTGITVRAIDFSSSIPSMDCELLYESL